MSMLLTGVQTILLVTALVQIFRIKRIDMEEEISKFGDNSIMVAILSYIILIVHYIFIDSTLSFTASPLLTILFSTLILSMVCLFCSSLKLLKIDYESKISEFKKYE